MLHELFKLDVFHLTNLIHPIVIQTMHVGVELCIRDGKIGFKEDGVDVVDVLSARFELGKILV